MTVIRTTSRFSAAALAMALCLMWQMPARAESRLKDVIALQGFSTAPLIGYGLVVGLDKTGDKQQTIFSTQSLANMLARFGVVITADQLAQMKVENVAAVLVTAELSPYERAGGRIDVIASSIGDARSLQGGTLLPTSLRGPTGEEVAMAQGPLSIGGFGGGSGGSSVQVNHLTVGRIPGGAVVENAPPTPMPASGTLMFSLRDPDFITASHVAEAINTRFGGSVAHAIDPGSVALAVPAEFKGQVPELMAQIEELPVEVDTVARVVINERTGTVVVGGDVRLGPAAVAHGNLSVKISTQYQVSQPTPFSTGGQTTTVPDTHVDIREGTAKLVSLQAGATLDSVASALNALGATPRDIIAIMQALKAAGALHADIVIL